MSSLEPLVVIFALLLGGVVGWVLASQRGRLALVRAEGEAKAQAQALEETQARLEDQFRSLASQVLSKTAEDNRREFLALAGKTLGEKKGEVETLLKPMHDTLAKLELSHKELEKSRAGAYQGLRSQITQLEEQTRSLRDVSVSLSTALKGGSSQAVGQWGENTLKKLLEQAGMLEHSDFAEQETIEGPEGRGRPDVVIHLPDGGAIAVDAKCPITAFLRSYEAEDPQKQADLLTQHTKDCKKHVDDLGKRDYSRGLDGSVPFTVLFLPHDSLLAAAYQTEPEIWQYAFKRGVLLATPVTLLALLQTVAVYWDQRERSNNLDSIVEECRKFYDSVRTYTGYLKKMGSSLNGLLTAYNAALASYTSRVLPKAEKLDKLKLKGHRGADKKERYLAGGEAQALVKEEEVQKFTRRLQADRAEVVDT